MISNKVFSAATWVLMSLILCSCGGGGGGGGATPMSYSTTISLVNLQGDIDPDRDGTAFITYSLNYPEATTVDIKVEYSINGGAGFFPCTEDTSSTLNGEPNPTEGLTGLSAGPGGIEHTFAWDSDAPGDLPNTNINWLLVRVSVINGTSVTSDYLTLINNSGDPTNPELVDLEAVAVQGPNNDTLTITFNKAVVANEAEDLDNYSLENPASVPMPIPPDSSIDYNPVTKVVKITLDGAGEANLQYNTQCTVTALNIHDLSGKPMVSGSGDSVSDMVGGDGENGASDQPLMELAYFTGYGTPQQGETLLIFFNEEMQLKNINGFNTDDIEFWDAGQSLGSTNPLPISMYDSTTLEITLGYAPNFQPDISRIIIALQNDVIFDLAGNKPFRPANPVITDYTVIIYEDVTDPVLDLLTLNHIPDPLNGRGPAGGTLNIPPTGFDITMTYYDVGGAGVDLDDIEIWNYREVYINGLEIPAATNLTPFLEAKAVGDFDCCYGVPSNMMFPLGSNNVYGKIKDRLGNESPAYSLPFNVITPGNYVRPFETNVNPSQVWRLIFTRDLYSITHEGTSYKTVNAIPGGNGTPDFEEDLLLYGLGCETPLNLAGLGVNSNEFLQSLVKDEVMNQLSVRIFPGVNINFVEEPSGSFPGNAPQVWYHEWGHSQICIGGMSDVGALGCAFIDRGNNHQDNDTLYNGSVPYNPGTHLGVFSTAIYIYEVNTWMMSLFRLTYDPFIPGRGTPVGEQTGDTDILLDMAGVGPSVSGTLAARRDKIAAAVNRLARAIAVTTAHEMGHSMGLSVDGAMPSGLYGGDSGNFPGSTSNHINLTANAGNTFTPPSVNIMIPATNFLWCNSQGTMFNRLNLAYLFEKAFYNP